jgi:hypothetical protein
MSMTVKAGTMTAVRNRKLRRSSILRWGETCSPILSWASIRVKVEHYDALSRLGRFFARSLTSVNRSG